MPLDYAKLMAWPFPPIDRDYTTQDLVHFAKGFGAGVDSAWATVDAPYLRPDTTLQALPMAAVALADGEFWQQDPATGIDWRQLVHVQESLALHRPLPSSGRVRVTQKVADIFDRGSDKGAQMLQNLELSDAQGPIASIEVSTLLRGNGGFGGQPNNRPHLAPIPQRAADATIEIKTPQDPHSAFRLNADINIGKGTEKIMIRGLGCFGLAGRGVIALSCDNHPQRLKKIAVRYAGPMYTDETMRLELWHITAGQVVFRLHAVERDQPVLSQGVAHFDPLD
ncbi:hypothetical protein LZ023_14690 [Pseudomonas silvicola]|nr:hypothetical protein LZ023_14690 [Pseudomonas silvicola]